METKRPSQAHEGSMVLPVIAEQLRLGVRRVDTGRGVRIHKTVVEREQRIEQSLLHDAVSVTRVPVDRIVPLSETPVARQEGDTWIVPILEEVLVLEKRLRIKEEVHITRTARAQPYFDTVVLRSEQVAVERFDERDQAQVNSTNGGSQNATHTRGGIR
jgi:stress response protein YsnF